MAETLVLTDDIEKIEKTLERALQSGNINFLIGSGASQPAISVAGDIEKTLNECLDDDDEALFTKTRNDFLVEIQSVTNELFGGAPNPSTVETIGNYQDFLRILVRILDERKTDLLAKQVSIFTTNYDLFVEHASAGIPTLRLNDGFNRNPTVGGSFSFEPETFFDALYKTGNLFNYKFPVPVVNLIKLHGSLSWKADADSIEYQVESKSIPDAAADDYVAKIEQFSSEFSLILPTKKKFNETLLDRIYYDLLRIYANTMEIENTVLFSFGFSFEDEHILDITKRALKNPTLLLILLAYSDNSKNSYQDKFAKYDNVLIIHPEDNANIKFDRLNELLKRVVPNSRYD
ncbi:SIR2 family protein [Roseovarius sp. 2305UL8-3]|uniref:SIR2 family protein n=1 Tax=Roseovarius conchicola TaxID=3121636 RepID=UPI003528191D